MKPSSKAGVPVVLAITLASRASPVAASTASVTSCTVELAERGVSTSS